jgi:hypothetical protein
VTAEIDSPGAPLQKFFQLGFHPLRRFAGGFFVLSPDRELSQLAARRQTLQRKNYQMPLPIHPLWFEKRGAFFVSGREQKETAASSKGDR